MNIISRVNIALSSLSAQSWQYRDRRKPEVGTIQSILYSYRMTSRAIYSAQYHRQHCALQAFEEFGALYMHNFDDTCGRDSKPVPLIVEP